MNNSLEELDLLNEITVDFSLKAFQIKIAKYIREKIEIKEPIDETKFHK